MDYLIAASQEIISETKIQIEALKAEKAEKIIMEREAYRVWNQMQCAGMDYFEVRKYAWSIGKSIDFLNELIAQLEDQIKQHKKIIARYKATAIVQNAEQAYWQACESGKPIACPYTKKTERKIWIKAFEAMFKVGQAVAYYI